MVTSHNGTTTPTAPAQLNTGVVSWNAKPGRGSEPAVPW